MARYSSIDAFRGITVAAMLLVNNAGDWDHVYPWLEHAEWNGCHLADFIFPFFLLIVGVSLSLALANKIETPEGRSQMAKSVVLRGLKIVLLGLALHWLASLTIDGRAFRLMGVLQRIGICFVVAGLCHIYLRIARIQWDIIALILVGYWLLLAGEYQPQLNLADRIDTWLLGAHAYQFDPVTKLAHDPEGILSTLPSLATVFFGIRAGEWLRTGQHAKLCIVGFLLIVAGGLWSLSMPLNKQLWTSSFVLWTAGFGLLAMSLLHYLIDQKNWPAIGKSFGINAIVAYAGSWVGICFLYGTGLFEVIYQRIFVVIFSTNISPEFASMMFSITFTGFFWLILKFMAYRGWRIVI